MLKFNHLDEAVQKAAFLKEFCYGVRIVGFDDGAVLYSSLPQTGEDFSPRQAGGITSGGTAGFERSESERTLVVGRNRETYEITSVPVAIGESSCRLEMIQPHRQVISAVIGEPVVAFNGQQYLASTIGGLLVKDTLTGLFNRRYIDETLPLAIRHANISGQPLSILFMDIDQFKAVNDRYGHIVGDLALQHVAQLLQRKIRRTDSWVARYGGDEFVVCLPGANGTAALRIANRLRVTIMNEKLPLENGALCLTCSFGVQTMDPSDDSLSAQMLLYQADEKLYQAKNAGRNAVM